jgi:cytochrome c
MKTIAILLAASLAAVATAAGAQSGEDLIKKNGCTACHAIDKKVVGPAYKDVANKYRNDKAAPANLMKKVKAGGSGVWGQVPMPPNPQVKDDELKTMIDYILALK